MIFNYIEKKISPLTDTIYSIRKQDRRRFYYNLSAKNNLGTI